MFYIVFSRSISRAPRPKIWTIWRRARDPKRRHSTLKWICTCYVKVLRASVNRGTVVDKPCAWKTSNGVTASKRKGYFCEVFCFRTLKKKRRTSKRRKYIKSIESADEEVGNHYCTRPTRYPVNRIKRAPVTADAKQRRTYTQARNSRIKRETRVR